jgi:hypothetical protein
VEHAVQDVVVERVEEPVVDTDNGDEEEATEMVADGDAADVE